MGGSVFGTPEPFVLRLLACERDWGEEGSQCTGALGRGKGDECILGELERYFLTSLWTPSSSQLRSIE